VPPDVGGNAVAETREALEASLERAKADRQKALRQANLQLMLEAQKRINKCKAQLRAMQT
jgi:hypothetical protein